MGSVKQLSVIGRSRDEVAEWLMDLRRKFGAPGNPIALNHNLHWSIVEGVILRCEEARAAERDAIVAWLASRCEYGPPCDRCTYCSVRLSIAIR